MTPLLALSIAFATLTLIVVAGVVGLLRRRGIAGSKAARDCTGGDRALSPAPREEN